MPFITEEHRKDTDVNVPGDRCYLFYKEMVEDWRRQPRWATADTIMVRLLDYLDRRTVNQSNRAAALLAFMVFFNLEVMPYELKKREENGDV